MLQIEALRRRKGCTQQQLASCMGVTQAVVSCWERESVLPRTRDLPRLAKVLGCTIDDLFSPEDPEDNHYYIPDLAAEP